MEYFAQDQYKELDPNATLIDDLSSAARNRTSTELRNLLGCFLFSGDDVEKKMGVLSGGEKNRYALARLLLQPANFLLLDEPTNHLDMRAKDVLWKGKIHGNGGICPHDRTYDWRRKPKSAAAKQRLPCNYEDYLASQGQFFRLWRIKAEAVPSQLWWRRLLIVPAEL
jgi:ATP-binding cassette subfamily F protein 3